MKTLLSLFLASSLGLVRLALGELCDAPPSCVQGSILPGPEHARLQRLVGTWDALIVTRDAGGEHRTRGTLTVAPHTSFHTLESFDGELMGLPFLGHGVNGYCPVRKKYFTFWTDSMTPAPLLLYGDWDEGKRELTLAGEGFGPSGKLEPCRTVARHVDDDHFTWAFYGAGPDGKEVQHLSIEYRRRK